MLIPWLDQKSVLFGIFFYFSLIFSECHFNMLPKFILDFHTTSHSAADIFFQENAKTSTDMQLWYYTYKTNITNIY